MSACAQVRNPVYKLISEVYTPVSLLVQISELMPGEGHILIIALLWDWQGSKYFTPSSWDHQVVITWQRVAKRWQHMQNLGAANLSDWQKKI